MRILVVSDLHANLEAVRALPSEFDELWVLGDLVNYGPNPNEVIDFVRTNASLVVCGNHDYAVARGVDPQCSPRFRRMAEETCRFTTSVITEAGLDFLRSLPLTAERQVAGVRFLACHATPQEPLYRYLGPDSPFWEDELRLAPADVVLAGHTHLPFCHRRESRMVLNPGSAGQPKNGVPKACYAIWTDGEAHLETAEYGFEETVGKIRSLPVSEQVKEDLTLVLRTGSSSGLP